MSRVQLTEAVPTTDRRRGPASSHTGPAQCGRKRTFGPKRDWLVANKPTVTGSDLEERPAVHSGASSDVRLEQIGREITARLGKLDQLGVKAVDQVDSIGQLLAEAEKLCATPKAFDAFKRQHCPDLGRSRTYELLGVKGGRKSLEEIRALTRARVAKHRAGKKTVTDTSSVTSDDGTEGRPEPTINPTKLANQGNGESPKARVEKRKVRSDEEQSLPPDENLVTKNEHDYYVATPWFSSRIKPIYEGTIKNDAVASAAALSQFKTACATLLPQMTIDDLDMAQKFLDAVRGLEEEVKETIREAELAVADEKRIKWEAKNPNKAVEKARKEAQKRTMEDDDEYHNAKDEARENGETWSDIKDEWTEDWLENNWDEEAEAEFEAEFRERWLKDHGEPWSAA
jgi:hypothetical protein